MVRYAYIYIYIYKLLNCYWGRWISPREASRFELAGARAPGRGRRRPRACLERVVLVLGIPLPRRLRLPQEIFQSPSPAPSTPRALGHAHEATGLVRCFFRVVDVVVLRQESIKHCVCLRWRAVRVKLMTFFKSYFYSHI